MFSTLTVLEGLIFGKPVLACGNAPKLRSNLSEINLSDFTIIAADGAAAVLMDMSIVPEVICTDLDSNFEVNFEKEILACEHGSIVLTHAHGDNIYELEKYVPRFKRFIATTWIKPLGNVYNFGGFPQGDRCVFYTMEFPTKTVKLAGFDFEDSRANLVKKKKLKWAEKLIAMSRI